MASPAGEASEDGRAAAAVDCFGEAGAIEVIGTGAVDAVSEASGRLASWGRRFWRENEAGEVAQLNADPRRELVVSPLMARLIEALARAFRATDGLVDSSLVDELDALRESRAELVPLATAVRRFPPRVPARPRPQAIFPFEVDRSRALVTRLPGAKFDAGELIKAVIADVCAGTFEHRPDYMVDCAGKLRFGGPHCRPRVVRVTSPFGGQALHEFRVAGAAVATDGIGARVWLDGRGRPLHRLVDPRTGRPAFTGVVQATAIARTGFEAAVLAQAAALSGRVGAAHWLRRGGLIVFDDVSHIVIAPAGSAPRSGLRTAATITARVSDSWPR